MRTASETASLAQVRRLAQLLDNSIPLPGGARIGWDAVLGLIPGVGDAAGALLSGYIVVQALRLGAPAPVLTRMLGNIATEALVGAVPFLGDVFDAAFKANARNARLLEQHLAAPTSTRRASRAWVVGVLLALVVLLGAIIAVAVLTTRALVSLVSGS